MNCVIVILFVLLLVFGLIFAYKLGRERALKDNDEQVSNVKQHVDELLQLEEIVELARDYKRKDACLKDVCELLHDYFFFGEFKNPEAVYNDLVRRCKGYGAREWSIDENKAIIAMYDELLKGVRKTWLEEKE